MIARPSPAWCDDECPRCNGEERGWHADDLCERCYEYEAESAQLDAACDAASVRS